MTRLMSYLWWHFIDRWTTELRPGQLWALDSGELVVVDRIVDDAVFGMESVDIHFDPVDHTIFRWTDKKRGAFEVEGTTFKNRRSLGERDFRRRLVTCFGDAELR